MKTNRDIPDLLAKAMVGRLSDEEEKRLAAWREENGANERLYAEVMAPECLAKKVEEVASVDIVAGYARVMAKYRRHVRGRRLRRWAALAAGIVLPLAVAVWAWTAWQDEEGTAVPMAAGIKPGEVKAELVLADGTVRHLRREHRDSVLTVGEGRITVKREGVSYEDTPAPAEVRYNTLRVPRGGEYAVTLSDGTMVQLNSESELRYPVVFAGERREVFLKGEGFFRVTRDEAHPFVVGVGEASVEVLGTSFNVTSYADEEEVRATLVEGSIRFAAGEREAVLVPGEQGVLKASGEMSVQAVDTLLATAWTRGVFAFRQQPLEEIMRTVSRWYAVEVFWENPSLKEVTFTGKMERYDDFARVVQILEMTGDVCFVIRDNHIFIRSR